MYLKMLVRFTKAVSQKIILKSMMSKEKMVRKICKCICTICVQPQTLSTTKSIRHMYVYVYVYRDIPLNYKSTNVVIKLSKFQFKIESGVEVSIK